MSRTSRVPLFASVLGLVALLFAVVAPVPARAMTHVGIPTGLDRVDVAVTPSGDGAWLLSADGTIITVGDAPLHGRAEKGPGDPGSFVGIAAHRDGDGYWVVDTHGKVWAFGQAELHGEIDFPLNEPIVGIAATPMGAGYWLAASDGGVFAFGDANFLGGMGGVQLNQPVVGIAAARNHVGYWLVASDGGVFTFGDQHFHGSTGDIALNEPITGITSTNSGRGYWLVASDGGVFSFGDAPFLGSIYTREDPRAQQNPFIGIETAWGHDGYFIVDRGGALLGFGDALIGPAPPADPVEPIGEMRTDPRESDGFPGLGRIALLTDINAGAHPGFERIVFEFQPGDLEYSVRYVDEPPVNIPGEPVHVAGNAMLHVEISGASGVDLSVPEPVETYTGPTRFAPIGLDQVQEMARVSDFEAHMEWVIGTRQQVPFAVARLSDPTRLVIDIADEAGDVGVYFTPGDGGPDCSDVVRLPRSVEGQAVLTGAMEALLAGPDATERDAGYTSWFSADTAGMLRSVVIDDRVARIDFDDFSSVIPSASTSCGSAKLLAQLGATATQFETVDRAVYSFEGSVANFYTWLQLAPPD